MWIGLLWIVGSYGAGIVVVHLLFGTHQEKPAKKARVLLITKNNATQIEWYIRSMFFFSKLKGREIAATILDEGSTDDTMKIIERLSHTQMLDVQVWPVNESVDEVLRAHEEDDWVVVHISNRVDIVKMPLFQQ